MKWYVLHANFQTDEIEFYNVLNDGIVEIVKKRIKKEKAKTFEQIREILKSELMYRYWCRAEYEIMVGDLFADEKNFRKIDIYSQVEPNLDIMTKYFIDNAKIKTV